MFWCLEHAFENIPGIISTEVGFSGGKLKNPTYKQVSNGSTKHIESVNIIYDPTEISYEKILEIFWFNIDPTTNDGQFCDKGPQYRSAVFFHDETQRLSYEKSKEEIIKTTSVTPILTEIIKYDIFFKAEEYHQKYYKKNPFSYNFYRYNCGRDKRLKELWGSSIH